jgi:diguanylate cyclase (GGDEF)-like protein
MNGKVSFDPIIKERRKRIKQLKKKIKGEGKAEELAVETQYLYSLLEITRSININQDFNKLLELIVDSAIILTMAERGFLILFSKDGNLEFRVTRNYDKETLDSEDIEISKTVVNRVLATGKSLFLSDIFKDKQLTISESIEALRLRMVMCVPLMTKKGLLGLLYVDSHSETESFTNIEENIFEAFAAQASIAVENSYLYDSSVRDALTGLYDYGYLRTRLEEEVIRASRFKKENISFLMLDLDDFKLINDSYGHLFGNSILVKVAEFIKKTVRKYDIAARYGGDEFAVLMPNADEKDARSLAKRLQMEISNLRLLVGKEVVSISTSIGISSFPIEKIVDSENIIIEADHALYIAKGKGKNQIAVFGRKKDEMIKDPALIGKSKSINDVKQMISKLANTDATILIIGETGTGKELVTNLIHQQSARSDKPFVVVNCGAIPDNLLESELFGYEKGAFTGAYRQHKGKFEVAHGGTIFLDEIGELPLHLQVKFLRVLEQKEIDRIGGRALIKIDVRVIAASNKDLENEVKHGNFRKDLFYRLGVATIHLPPLRERPEDIETISKHYLKQMNKTYHRQFAGFTKSAMDAMLQHTWPGNVRELIHRIERAVIISTGQHLNEMDLGLTSPKSKKMKTMKESRDEAERESLIQTLICNRWNITHTSKVLGISRKTVTYLMQKHNIVKPDVQEKLPQLRITAVDDDEK